jgi:lipopolysaccharide transport system ATP-binding protein
MTLLKMLNGLIKPDRGTITRQARRASRFGRTANQIDQKIDEIIDFAEIREAIDMSVQNYSSGMNVRLGFAVATALDPSFEIVKNRPHSRLF